MWKEIILMGVMLVLATPSFAVPHPPAGLTKIQLEGWKECFNRCSTEHCSYCNGNGTCEHCWVADNCPACSGQCTVPNDRSGDLCLEGCAAYASFDPSCW